MNAIDYKKADVSRRDWQPHVLFRYLRDLKKSYPAGVPRAFAKTREPDKVLFVIDLREQKYSSVDTFMESEAAELLKKVVEDGVQREYVAPQMLSQAASKQLACDETGCAILLLAEQIDFENLESLVEFYLRRHSVALKAVVLSDNPELGVQCKKLIGNGSCAVGGSVFSLLQTAELKKDLWRELKRIQIS